MWPKTRREHPEPGSRTAGWTLHLLPALLSGLVMMMPVAHGVPTATGSKNPSPDDFFRGFAQPQLSLRAGHPWIRVSQALLRCAHLDSTSKDALARLLQREEDASTTMQEHEYIVACAQGMLDMVAGGVFPDIQAIPEAFRAQLLYSTMRVPQAYPALISILPAFSSSTRTQSLNYAFQCESLLAGIGAGADRGQLDLPTQPMVLAGCLRWIRAELAPSAAEAENDQSSTVSALLKQLEGERTADLQAYDAMLAEHAPTFPASLERFVERGGLLRTAVTPERWARWYGNATALSSSTSMDALGELDAWLRAGLDVRPKPSMDTAYPFLHGLQGEESRVQARLVWFASRGLDVHDGYGSKHGNYLLWLLRTHRKPEDRAPYLGRIHLLLYMGADPERMETDGNAALSYLSQKADLPLLQEVVREGAPSLAHRNAAGETILWSLLRFNADRGVLQFLVEQGLDAFARSGSGQTAISYADDMGWKSLSDWMKTLTDKTLGGMASVGLRDLTSAEQNQRKAERAALPMALWGMVKEAA